MTVLDERGADERGGRRTPSNDAGGGGEDGRASRGGRRKAGRRRDELFSPDGRRGEGETGAPWLAVRSALRRRRLVGCSVRESAPPPRIRPWRRGHRRIGRQTACFSLFLFFSFFFSSSFFSLLRTVESTTSPSYPHPRLPVARKRSVGRRSGRRDLRGWEGPGSMGHGAAVGASTLPVPRMSCLGTRTPAVRIIKVTPPFLLTIDSYPLYVLYVSL